jgi:hypothetical protein
LRRARMVMRIRIDRDSARVCTGYPCQRRRAVCPLSSRPLGRTGRRDRLLHRPGARGCL